MANKIQAFNIAIEITKQYARSAEDSKEPARILKETYEMLLKLQDDVGKEEVV